MGVRFAKSAIPSSGGGLGHVSLDTTHRYAEIKARAKEA